MSTKFYVGQKDYIEKLNELDDTFVAAGGAPATTAANLAAALAAKVAAEAAASGVATNATNAGNSATTATAQAGVATTKAGEAVASAASAATAKTAAEAAATAAGISATAADASKTAAASSATAAAASQSSVSTVASSATASKDAAAISATAANTAKDAASASATTASNAATAASASAAAALANKNATDSSTTTAANAASAAAADRLTTTNARDLAVGSKDIAVTKAGEAATSAGNAAASASNAQGYQNTAGFHATAAETSKTAAYTSESYAKLSENAAIAARDVALANAALLGGAAAILPNTAAASAAASSASVSNSAAASSAAQAKAANESALQAWAASTYPMETLAAISKTIHSGVVVKSIIYDSGRDSDGGAWRKRCQDKSWYTEALGGTTWLGQAATELAARGDNLLSYSEELDNAGWTKAASTVAANTAVAPDGTTTADKIVEDTTTAGHYVTKSVSSSVSGAPYTFSVFVKAAGRSWALVLFEAGAGNFQGHYVNLATGALGVQYASGATTVVTNAGNGWWKITVSAVTTGTVGNVRVYCAAADNNSNQLGDGASGLYVWGAKLNKVGELPSTYSASPELVTNGGFDNGTVGWVAASAGSSAVSSLGGLVTLYGDGTNAASLTQGVTTVIGKTYILNMTIGAGNAAGVILGSTAGGVNLASNYSAVTGSVQLVFTATSTTSYLQVYRSGTGAASFDNVSIKEVTVLATPYVPYSQLATSYYQNTTDGKFYTLNSTYGQTEVFRGNVREFPEQVAIFAEAGRVVIYDLTQVGVPMWRVIKAGTPGPIWGGTTFTSLAAAQGSLYLGQAITTGYTLISFLADLVVSRRNDTTGYGLASVAASVTSAGTNPVGYWSSGIVSGAVNDIAVTVLDNAPIDPATGLPVPTIAVATNGGVSIIKDDGSVVNMTVTNSLYSNARRVVFLPRNRIAFNMSYQGLSDDAYCYISDIPAVSLSTASATAFAGVSGEFYKTYTIPAIMPAFNNGGILSGFNITQKGFGHNTGVTLLNANNAVPAKGMVAYVTNAYNTGWQVGDARLTALADTVAETITAPELVVNGTFDTDTAGWSAAQGGVLSVSGGKLVVTQGTGGLYGQANQSVPTVIGKVYRFTFHVIAGTSVNGSIVQVQGITVAGSAVPGTGNSVVFVATAPLTPIVCAISSGSASGLTAVFDNLSVTQLEVDRSVKANGLSIIGAVQKAPVASGAGIVFYGANGSFNSTNYLEQAYSANLDFGTGDFHFAWWETVTNPIAQQQRFSRGIAGGAKSFTVLVDASVTYKLLLGAATVNSGFTQLVGTHKFDWVRESGTLKLYVDGVMVYSVANAVDITVVGAPLRIGTDTGVTPIWTAPPMALLRLSATAPSADQIAYIYRTELPLFQPNAQCTIDGTSTAVTALAYDDNTDVLHVGTSWGRTAFKGLLRIESAVSTVGSITSIAANQGAHISAGASAGRYYQPALLLRDELRRKEEAKKALGKVPVFFEFDAIAAQVAFVLPKGYTTKAVYSGGVLKRVGSTKDYLISNDGFVETVTFAVAPGAAAWVSVMAVRSN